MGDWGLQTIVDDVSFIRHTKRSAAFTVTSL
jgi:hypothetical protein